MSSPSTNSRAPVGQALAHALQSVHPTPTWTRPSGAAGCSMTMSSTPSERSASIVAWGSARASVCRAVGGAAPRAERDGARAPVVTRPASAAGSRARQSSRLAPPSRHGVQQAPAHGRRWTRGAPPASAWRTQPGVASASAGSSTTAQSSSAGSSSSVLAAPAQAKRTPAGNGPARSTASCASSCASVAPATWIAPTGHAATQWPQASHAELLTVALSSHAEIALVGHASMQSPQRETPTQCPETVATGSRLTAGVRRNSAPRLKPPAVGAAREGSSGGCSSSRAAAAASTAAAGATPRVRGTRTMSMSADVRDRPRSSASGTLRRQTPTTPRAAPAVRSARATAAGCSHRCSTTTTAAAGSRSPSTRASSSRARPSPARSEQSRIAVPRAVSTRRGSEPTAPSRSARLTAPARRGRAARPTPS